MLTSTMRTPLAGHSVLCVLVGLGCTPLPPPNWEPGGARLAIPTATWQRDKGHVVRIEADGKVFDGDRHVLSIDIVGRAVDRANDPVAILLPDGQVAGPDAVNLGHVGVTNAAPPGQATAWLAVLPDGAVLYFNPDGSRAFGGTWTGCEGPAHRTCTYVTHLFGLNEAVVYAPATFGMGVGVGMGIYP